MKFLFIFIVFSVFTPQAFGQSMQTSRPFGGRIILPDVPGVTCTDPGGQEIVIRDLNSISPTGMARPMIAAPQSKNRFGQVVPGALILGSFSLIRVPCVNEQTGVTILLRRSRIHGTNMSVPNPID
jgi:hypothetical protein